MGWATATRAVTKPAQIFCRPTVTPHVVDWSRLVSLDFETYYDADYTLSKLSTSEYIRDSRFEALMVGVKIGNGKTKVVPGPKVRAELSKINWATHSALCHNMLFDGFILGHHFGVHPKTLYCSLSMARGLHSNEIGAGLDEVSLFYGGRGKIEGGVESMKGLRYAELAKDKIRLAASMAYCAQDVDEMLHIFKQMLPLMPADEMDLIHMTNRMFVEPVLRVNIPRVEKELARELAERDTLLLNVIDPEDFEADVKNILKTKAERELIGKERHLLMAKRIVGSSEKFADLLRAEGIEPPVKISPAWIKKPKDLRDDADKWAYAFAKDDAEFINLPDTVETLGTGLDLDNAKDVQQLALRQARVRILVDCRLAVKSTTNITRAQRFLTAGADGMPLPCGYKYAAAHTLRWGGTNKMNMQNLTRGGELRQSIEAPPGHELCVADSGQIEARVNGWLWGQDDLMEAFRSADNGSGRDAYCLFGDIIYGREITKADKMERFVGKVCVLALGFQMGAPKFQMTLAKGALGGPPVYFELERCKAIVNAYRRKNHRIQKGWEICKGIIEDMAAGRQGRHGPISWEKDTVWLPNGMALKYPDLKKRINSENGWEEWSYQAKDLRKKIYGGLLCENIVQALARIIVAGQMLMIDKFARIVMTTHDEAVACVKKAQAPLIMKRMLKAMQTPLPWCLDLPLNAEGGHAPNYSK